jgi:hypothetical protein
LKSKRVAISLAVFSTPFFTSTTSASHTVSKEGMLVTSEAQVRQFSDMIIETQVPLQAHNTFGIAAKSTAACALAQHGRCQRVVG